MAATVRQLYGAEDLRQIQRVNEEIARLARLAARPGRQLPLFDVRGGDRAELLLSRSPSVAVRGSSAHSSRMTR